MVPSLLVICLKKIRNNFPGVLMTLIKGDYNLCWLVYLENPVRLKTFNGIELKRDRGDFWSMDEIIVLAGMGEMIGDIAEDRLKYFIYFCVISGDIETMERITKDKKITFKQIEVEGDIMCSERVDIDMIKYLFDWYYVNFWDYCLSWAAFYNNPGMVKYLIEAKKASNWREGMRGAISGGNFDLVKFFEDLGYNNWDLCLSFAILSDRKDMIKYFVEKIRGIVDLSFYIEIAEYLTLEDIAKYIEQL